MLVLDRYAGEAVLVGELRLEVLQVDVDMGLVHLAIGTSSGEEVYVQRPDERFAVGQATVLVTGIREDGRALLGIDAPRSVNIRREELTERRRSSV